MKTVILLKDRVFELRKAEGLTQQQLGEVLGLTSKSISMLESGGRSTTIDKLVILAEHFHVSTDYLLGVTDDPAWRGTPPKEDPWSIKYISSPLAAPRTRSTASRWCPWPSRRAMKSPPPPPGQTSPWWTPAASWPPPARRPSAISWTWESWKGPGGWKKS